MKTRFKIVTSALALILAIGGGSITFGGSNRGRESNKDASESTRPVNLEDSGFAGSWTGQGFTATIANDGTGTVNSTRLQCVATLSFTSLVDHVLTLRYVVTADSGAHCIRTGVITARMNAKNSSTWIFVGEDGSTVSGSATRVITPRVNRELLASFAGTATGGVAPADFTVVLNRSGSGTITFPSLQCSGTLTFISFDNVVLKLRLDITVRQGSLCVENGVASATQTTPGSSTWRFVGDSGIITDGVTVSSAVTVTPDHSCDHASEKAAKLSEHQAELSQRIGKLQAQTNALNAGRAKAVLDGNLKKVASIDKRIAGIRRNIEHKQSQMNDNNDEEHNVEHHCNITPPPPPPPPPTVTCADGSVHNLPFTCPPPPPTVTCADGSVHNLPFTCPPPPPPPPPPPQGPGETVTLACNNTFSPGKIPIEYNVVASASSNPIAPNSTFAVDFDVTVRLSPDYLNGIYASLAASVGIRAIPINSAQATIVPLTGATGAPVVAKLLSTFTIPTPVVLPAIAAVSIPLGSIRGIYTADASGEISFTISGNAYSPTVLVGAGTPAVAEIPADSTPFSPPVYGWTPATVSPPRVPAKLTVGAGDQTFTKISLIVGAVVVYHPCMGGSWTQYPATVSGGRPTYGFPLVAPTGFAKFPIA